MIAPLEIIRAPLPEAPGDARRVLLRVERQVLAKRRWRGAAEDGREFGFDLATPLADGAPFFADANRVYAIAQTAEPVLEIPFAQATAARAAELGWRLGNLHFPLEITADVIRVADDSAIRQMLEREHIAFVATSAVFHPLKGGHHHH